MHGQSWQLHPHPAELARRVDFASDRSLPCPPLSYSLPYANQGAGTRTLELLQVAHNYSQWIYERLRPGIGRRVLEIGCGLGTITQMLLDRDLVIGVDVVDEFVVTTAPSARASLVTGNVNDS